MRPDASFGLTWSVPPPRRRGWARGGLPLHSAGSLSPGFPAHRVACDDGWLPHTRGSSACGYRQHPVRRAHRLPPRRRRGRARTAGVRRRPVRLRPAAPVTSPDPDSGGRRPAGQSDAFGDWFITTSVPPRRGPPRLPNGPRRDRFGWLLSPWLLAPTATVAVATTGVALWLWQTAPTGTVQARPGAAVIITVPAATGGLPGGPGRPLRGIPPLPPGITPAQATASQSQAAGTGDEAGGTPAPPSLPGRNPGPLRLAARLIHPSRHHRQRPGLLSRLPVPRRNLASPAPTRRRPPSTAPRPQSLSPAPRRRLSPAPRRRLSPPPRRRLSPPRHRRLSPTAPPSSVTTPPSPPVSSPTT